MNLARRRYHSKNESSLGIRQISVPAAPITPAIITIAATVGSPRHLFAAITRKRLGKFHRLDMAREGSSEGRHHFRKRSALGCAATVRAIAPRAPISMIEAARIITVTPRRRFRDVL